jgi:hypothetical protein
LAWDGNWASTCIRGRIGNDAGGTSAVTGVTSAAPIHAATAADCVKPGEEGWLATWDAGEARPTLTESDTPPIAALSAATPAT